MLANAVITSNPLESLVKKNSFEICGKGHFMKWGTWIKKKKQIRGENNRKSGKKKYFNLISLAPDLWQLFPFWPSYGDSHFFVFCKMCNKFPFVVQWKMWCKQHTVCKLRFATFSDILQFFPQKLHLTIFSN